MKGHFDFKARNEKTWERFEEIWAGLSRRTVDGERLADAVQLRPERRSFHCDLSGNRAAGDIIYELFDALLPLQDDARRRDSGIDFAADWALRDPKGAGRGRMGRRFAFGH